LQATAAKLEQPYRPGAFTKRIGSTTYNVSIHFSKTSKETMNDKIIRLIRNDESVGKA
jgi:hypothetical protein